MPKPLRKPHRLLLCLSDDEHDRLRAMAAGQPLGPSIVAAALGSAREAQSPTGKPGGDLAAWEAWWMPQLRSSPMRETIVKALGALQGAVRNA